MKAWILLACALGSANAATLTWDALPANTGVVGYDIHYGPVAISPSTHVAVGNVLTAQMNTTGTNYFTVTGRDGAGKKSKPSNQVMYAQAAATPTPTPTPPASSWEQSKISDLRIASSSGATVTLAWTPPAGATSHLIYYSSDPQFVQMDKTQGAQSSPASVPGLQAGTTYYFEVRAYNSAGTFNQPSNRVQYAATSVPATPTPTPVPTPAPRLFRRQCQ